MRYEQEAIRKNMQSFYELFKGWKTKYEEKQLIDDEIYTIYIMDEDSKEIFIKNKYPDNWGRFILLRNKLIREEIEIWER